MYVFGNASYYQKDESCLNIKTIQQVTPWSVNVTIEAPLPILGTSESFVIKYELNSDFKLFSFIGNSVIVDLFHNYTIHRFTAGIKSWFGMFVFGNTSYYQIDKSFLVLDPVIVSCIHGFVDNDVVNISIELFGHGYNITLEFFYPPFATFISESVPLGFVKLYNQYVFSGYFETSDVITCNVTLILTNRKCFSGLSIDIPVSVSFQNSMGLAKVITMAYRKSLPCFDDITPIISRSINALPEYYGRGIYINAKNCCVSNCCIYVCMNQHVESTEAACFHSDEAGCLWKDLDVRVGSVIGHHLVTKDLFAIHRNQKTYLYFDGVSKRWLALSNQQFHRVSSNFDTSMIKNLEEDEEKIFTLGSNQWVGNSKGLFYANDSTSTPSLIFKWNF